MHCSTSVSGELEKMSVGKNAISLNQESSGVESRKVTKKHVLSFSGDMLMLNFLGSELQIAANHPVLLLDGANLEKKQTSGGYTSWRGQIRS